MADILDLNVCLIFFVNETRDSYSFREKIVKNVRSRPVRLSRPVIRGAGGQLVVSGIT